MQRRRADIRHYLETDTAFPERKDKEATYTFSKEYRALFDDILDLCARVRLGRATAASAGAACATGRRWRCCAASPPARPRPRRRCAAAPPWIRPPTRKWTRSAGARCSTRTTPTTPSPSTSALARTPRAGPTSTRRKLLEFARRAEAIAADADHKLQGAIREIKALLKDGFRPVVFCRFVDTADYVARQLREALPAKVRVESVTGLLPPAEREARIAALVAEPGEYVLVCTDCLSEGINLQQHFNAVLHYDLAWNPTRHEQREGRVDRFGQEKPEVRVVTYYGTDNPIDGVILDVLIRKHKSIKSDLGVTVAVPGSSEQIAEALFEGALFREQAGPARRSS